MTTSDLPVVPGRGDTYYDASADTRYLYDGEHWVDQFCALCNNPAVEYIEDHGYYCATHAAEVHAALSHG